MKDEDIIQSFDNIRTAGESAMPEFYALTSAKLYGIILRVVANEARAAEVLTDVYQHIWTTRHNRAVSPTMNVFISLAQRFALDYKLAGEKISRAPVSATQPSPNTAPISETELNLLCEICTKSQFGSSEPCYEPLTKDALRARLGGSTPKEGPS